MFLPCDDCLSVISDPKEDFRPLTPSGGTSQLTLSSHFYLLSRLPRKHPLIQPRLTSRLLLPCCRLVSLQGHTRTLPLPHQLAHNSPFLHLKLVNPKILKNFLHLVPSYLTFDPFYQGLITSNFNVISLLLDVNIAVNITQITPSRTKRPRFNQHLQYCLKPEFCKWEIVFFWDGERQEFTIQSTSLPSQRLVVPPQAITALPR